jgi:hypothetical protein
MLATGALRWLRSQQGNGHIAHRGSLMSYLNPLRLHFSGSFEADVSTVNNDPTHFDNDTFLPSYQERPTETEPNGWWNPRGSADWRLRGCAVTSAFLSDGSPASRSDAVRTAAVADSVVIQVEATTVICHRARSARRYGLIICWSSCRGLN